MGTKFFFVALAACLCAFVTMFANNGDPRPIKKKFKGAIIHGAKVVRSKLTHRYRQDLVRKNRDSIFYSVEFHPFASGKMDVVCTDQFVCIAPAIFVTQPPAYQKIFDFGARVHERWPVNDLFHHRRCTITFSGKIFDPVLKDSLFSFSIAGDKATSHTDYVDKVFFSKKHGIVRIDYTLETDGISLPDNYKAVFLSDDYVAGRKVTSFVEKNLIEQ